jgi:hypothetical protein
MNVIDYIIVWIVFFMSFIIFITLAGAFYFTVKKH